MSEETKRGSNDRNKTLALKKSIFTDASLPAGERLKAAHAYVSIVQLNKDNGPAVNRLIREFQDDPNPEMRERALRLKKRVMRLRDLKKIAAEPIADGANDQPTVDVESSTTPPATDTQSETESASTVLLPNVEFGYPPEDVIFPPPADVPYRLGEIDFTKLAVRLRGLPVPSPNTHEASENIIRAALGLTAWVPIELLLLQKLLYALRYEPKALDPTMPASQSSRYWPFAKLFAAVWYLGNVKHPYGSLRDAPLAPPTGAWAKSVFWQREYEYQQRENQHV